MFLCSGSKLSNYYSQTTATITDENVNWWWKSQLIENSATGNKIERVKNKNLLRVKFDQ